MGISFPPLRAVTDGHIIFDRESGLQAIDGFEIAIFHRSTADPMAKELTKVLVRTLNHECNDLLVITGSSEQNREHQI